ncbi:septum formation family protein [Mycolicibacterium sp.]|uniref:septum formation family protein n=1 Tax=Mycolicibacterium sp. TaxID=2320850 RepID=UPI001A2CBF29|nr:septum formation family protein [Mycolicibacterium sp.]MBJ7341587.1 septum formation family protein [Mycolicibacterium sp.]
MTIVAGGVTGCASRETASGGSTPVATTAASGTGAPDNRGRSVASYFKVGDCIVGAPTTGTDVRLVDCAQPHVTEVFGVYMLPDGDFPGRAAIQEVKNRCAKGHLAEYSAAGAKDPAVTTAARFPDAGSWAIGDRSVTCLAKSNPPRTGSLRDQNQ